MTQEKLKTIVIFVLAAAMIPAAIYRCSVFSDTSAREIPVFTYHRLCPDDQYPSSSREKDLWTKAGDFQKEMKWLHTHGYRTISMDEFYRWHQGRLDLPKKTVVITFDDGYYSVIKYGLPVLEKYHMKATMFVIGNTVTERQDLSDSMAYVSRETIDEVRRDYPGFEFQSHSYGLHHDSNRHAAIYDTSYKGILNDFQRQEGILGNNTKFLAYPYGYRTDDFENAARESGYKMAFLYGQKRGARRSDDPFRIPRIGIRGDVEPDVAFFRWLKQD